MPTRLALAVRRSEPRMECYVAYLLGEDEDGRTSCPLPNNLHNESHLLSPAAFTGAPSPQGSVEAADVAGDIAVPAAFS